MVRTYAAAVQIIERLHASFGELIKLELDGRGIQDCNHVQGLMLYKLGNSEMTVTDLTLRGCYLGSNVSYNVKKLTENGYLFQERSVHDRRSIRVKLTDKGRSLCDIIDNAHVRHSGMLTGDNISVEMLTDMNRLMERLDRMLKRAHDTMPPLLPHQEPVAVEHRFA